MLRLLMENFNNPVCKTYREKALVILRPAKEVKTDKLPIWKRDKIWNRGEKDGSVVGIADVATSGEDDVWKTITATVKSIKGIHDLYIVFKGEKDLFNFDWWQFKE